MSTNSPIIVKKTKSEGDVNIHLITSKKDLDAIAEIKDLKKKIADRVGDEELVFSVPSAKGLTIIAKIKKEGETSYRFQSARSLGAKLKKVLNGERAKTASLVSTADREDTLAVIEGIVLANYQFLRYKTGDRNKPNTLQNLGVKANGVSEKDLQELHDVAVGTFAARDFVNEPVITLSATEWSKRITKLGKDTGFKLPCWIRRKLKPSEWADF
jgi:leucyl aminopeptidase